MAFEDEPEGDPHGECAKEIRDLNTKIKEMSVGAVSIQTENGKLRIEGARLRTDNDTLSLNSDGIFDKLKAVELQVDAFPKKLLEAVKAEQDRCAQKAEHFWKDKPATKALKVERNTAYLISTSIRAMRWMEQDFTEKHLTNDTRKEPTDDERRAAKEARDRKFRPPDWTRSGRHG